MAVLRLATIQAALVAQLTAAQAYLPLLAGIPITLSKFGEEKSDEVITETLAQGGGLCILSIPPFAVRKQQPRSDLALMTVNLLVFVLENPELNLRGGLNRDPLEVVEAVWKATVGKPKGPQGFSFGNSSCDLQTENSAMRIYPIEFESQLTFSP